MLLRELFLHPFTRGGAVAGIALISLMIVACDGSGGGSAREEKNDFGAISRASAGSVTVPALSHLWVTAEAPLGRSATALTTGANVINEFVFSSNTDLFVSGLEVGGSMVYELDDAGITITGIREMLYFFGTWADGDLRGMTPSLVLPPIYTHSYPSGDYRFKLYNPTDSEATVQIIQVRKTDDDFSAGQMDLNFFIYGDGTVNDVVPDEAAARTIASHISDIFAQRGVTIGTVNVEFVTDSDAVAEVLEQGGVDSFLKRASQGTAGRNDKGINCFFLPRLTDGLLGKDGAIPGPSIVHGTAKSGLVAQAANLGWAIDGLTQDETNKWVLAKILAHELGHYAGLFHTIEENGYYVEALDDLPRCGKENDLDGDGKLSGPECRGHGTEYLMFWGFDGPLVHSGNLQTDLSTQEGQQLNTFPAVN